MANNLLLEILRQFEATKRSRLDRFVRSPYFNLDDKLVQLLHLLWEQMEGGIFDRAALDQALYPGSGYRYARINNHLSDLKQLVEQFIVQERLKTRPTEYRLQLLQASQEEGFEGLFRQQDRWWERQERADAYQNEQDFWVQLQLAETENLFFVGQDVRKADHHLDKMAEQGELFYVAHMLKALCQSLNRRNVVEDQSSLPALESFRNWFTKESPRFAAYLHIQLYTFVWQMLEKPEEEQHYEQLINTLSTREGEIPFAERKTLYQFAQNYCIRQANQGKSQYLSALFALYQTMITQGILLHQGQLSTQDLKNIVVLGSRLQEFAWTESFLEANVQFVPEAQRENMLIYNQAYLQYAKGELRAAMRLLSQVEFQDMFYFLESRSMLVRIYYELVEEDSLIAMLHAFDNALRRNRAVSAYRKKAYQQFIKLLRKLNRLRHRLQLHPPAKQQQLLAQFETTFQQTSGSINHAWLTAQWQALKSQYSGARNEKI